MNNNIGHNRLSDVRNHKVTKDGGFSAELHPDGSISLVRVYKDKSTWVADIKTQAPNEDGFETSERLSIGPVVRLSPTQAAEIANQDAFGGAKFQTNEIWYDRVK